MMRIKVKTTMRMQSMAMAEAIIQSRSPRLSSVDQFVCFSVQKGIFLQPLRDMADIAVLLLVNKINCLFTSLKFRTLMIFRSTLYYFQRNYAAYKYGQSCLLTAYFFRNKCQAITVVQFNFILFYFIELS